MLNINANTNYILLVNAMSTENSFLSEYPFEICETNLRSMVRFDLCVIVFVHVIFEMNISSSRVLGSILVP